QSRIFGGYDNIIHRRPHLGRWIRNTLYLLERTPFRFFGLSHLLVIEKRLRTPTSKLPPSAS
ncbi:MAG: hypothetical protein GYB65_06105, partial [Chloroflexi bacterium]|nr:hypothetical protein [Chloroflexota bacterium]